MTDLSDIEKQPVSDTAEVITVAKALRDAHKNMYETELDEDDSYQLARHAIAALAPSVIAEPDGVDAFVRKWICDGTPDEMAPAVKALLALLRSPRYTVTAEAEVERLTTALAEKDMAYLKALAREADADDRTMRLLETLGTLRVDFAKQCAAAQKAESELSEARSQRRTPGTVEVCEWCETWLRDGVCGSVFPDPDERAAQKLPPCPIKSARPQEETP